MTTGSLDPLIHHPARLRVVATLAALPEGDTLAVTRLQSMIGLTPASLATGLLALGHAGYLHTATPGRGSARASVALTGRGRAALGRYTATLRQQPRPAGEEHQAPALWLRAGDADRDAAAAALGEHFAQGRLTLDELNTRLDATLTATTHGDLAQVARDLPDLTVLPAAVSISRGKRARPEPKCGPAPDQRAWPRRRGRTRGGSS